MVKLAANLALARMVACKQSFYLHAIFGVVVFISLCRLLAFILITVALSACSPPDKTDLSSLPIPSVEFYPHEGETSVRILEAVNELAENFIDRGAKRGINGQSLITNATTTDEDIARSVDELPGPDWQRSAGFDSSRPHIYIMAWETAGYWHKRFYVIATWDKVYANKEGRKYRPIISVYSRP